MHELTEAERRELLASALSRRAASARRWRACSTRTRTATRCSWSRSSSTCCRAAGSSTPRRGGRSQPRRDRSTSGVPDDARRMIATQFERLSPADRSLLGAASVAGNEFAAQASRRRSAARSTTSKRAARRWRSPQRFLRFAGGSEWPDGSVALRYAFMHELYRQAVYEGISAGTSAAAAPAHRRGARDRLRRAGDGDRRRARGPLRARRRLPARAALPRRRRRRARRPALRRSRGRRLPRGRDRPGRAAARRGASGGGSELELRLALAPMLSDLAASRPRSCCENCERAYELCAAGRDPAQLFQILYASAHVHVARADTTRAPASLQELDDARTAPGNGRAPPAGGQRAGALRQRTRDVTPSAAASLKDRSRLTSTAQVSPTTARLRSGSGDRDQLQLRLRAVVPRRYRSRAGRPCATASPRRSGRHVSPFTQAAALGHMAILGMLHRNPAEVRRLADRLGASRGRAWISLLGSDCRGAAAAGRGSSRARCIEGIQELETARDALRGDGGPHVLHLHPRLPGRGAPACRRAGRRFGAVDEALARGRDDPRPQLLAGALAPQGRASRWRTLKAARPRRGARAAPDEARRIVWKEAEACLRRALDLAREAEAKSLELRAATSLARMWQARGRSAEARALLDGICGGSAANATSPDLTEARALLARLAPTRAHRRRAPHHPSA